MAQTKNLNVKGEGQKTGQNMKEKLSAKEQFAIKCKEACTKLEIETTRLRPYGITPFLTISADGPVIGYTQEKIIVERTIPIDDIRKFGIIQRTTMKGLLNEETEELDDLKVDKQHLRTAVLEKSGYKEISSNPKTKQRLTTDADNVLKIETLLDRNSVLDKYEEEHPEEKSQVNFVRACLEKKCAVLLTKLKVGSKEEDVAKTKLDIGMTPTQDVIASRMISVKEYKKKEIGKTIAINKPIEEYRSYIKTSANLMENKKGITKAAKAMEIEKAVRKHEVFEMNPTVNFWVDRELQTAKLEKLTDLSSRKTAQYLTVLEAEIQSLALGLFARSFGGNYDAAGLSVKKRKEIGQEIEKNCEGKEHSQKAINDLVRTAWNKAMIALPVTKDQWTNASMIAMLIRKATSESAHQGAQLEAEFLGEIARRRKALSDEIREEILNKVPPSGYMGKTRPSSNNFFEDKPKKKDEKARPKKAAPGFSDEDSILLYDRIKVVSKTLTELAPVEIKRELATAPMRIEDPTVRNKALTFVLQAFATCAAERENKLDEW